MSTKSNIPRIRGVPAAVRAGIEKAAAQDERTLSDTVRDTLGRIFGDEALMAAINAERGRASVGEFIHDILKAILLDDIDRPWLKDTRVIAVGEVKEAGSRVEYVQEGGR